MSALRGSDKLIEFELNRLSVAVLRMLNDEDHEKRHDRRCSIYHQLPRVAEKEEGASGYPCGNQAQCQGKSD